MPDNLSNTSSEKSDRIWESLVEFKLPEDILEHIKKEAKKTWETVEDIISKWLWWYLKDKYIEEERQEEIGDIIWDLSIKELESEVLHFMNTKPSEFAHWSEWQIFKMNIPGKNWEVMVVKRPYKETWESEYDLHIKIKEIEILYNKDNKDSIVKIPSIFHHFNDWNDEYVIMEYIHGKTLYLMIIEEILSSETIFLGEKIKDEKLKKLFYYHYYYLLEDKKIGDIDMDDFYSLSIDEILKLLVDENWYLKKIDLDCDSKWEDKFKVLYWILKDWWVDFDWDPKAVFDLDWGPVNKMIYENINFNDFSNIWFLSNTQILHLKNNLNNFISFMHKKWFYHMDIGWNTRNIIFTQKDWLYIPNIIDFWKSRFLWEKHNPSTNEKENDFLIIKNYIEKLWEEGKKKDKIVDNSIEDLYTIWNKFSINKMDIIANYNYYNRYSDIIYFNDLKEVLLSWEVPWWVKLDLWKNWENRYNGMVLSKIISLMYFTREENFWLIEVYINKIEKDKNFKIPFKKKIIKIYRELYKEVSDIRKKQD